VKFWGLLLPALGLAMFLEGLPYFVSPRGVKKYVQLLSRMSDAALRAVGLTLMVMGLWVAYLFTR
jgi:uncharacterized protein YjeT (DUF2065 family)